MTPEEIEEIRRLEPMAEVPDYRKAWSHYRFTPGNRNRPGLWNFMDRSGPPEYNWWRLTDSPSDEVLARLEPRGEVNVNGLTWRVYHDPAEYAKGH